MANFNDIVGQEQIKDHLLFAIKNKKVSHAYIISGEKSSGKQFISSVFANALVCEKGEGEICGECPACKQAAAKHHPDIKYISHEKPNLISVNDIREQINADVHLKPYSAQRKVYIIPEAEKMNLQAQNALLKTLEEPPEYVTIILLVTNSQVFLPTILSRCVLLTMKPVADEVLRNYLIDEVKVPDYRTEVCIAFARGNLGKAKDLAQSEEFDEFKSEALSVLKRIKDMEIHEMMASVKKMAELKFEATDFLDIISVWYRDVLLFKATADASGLIFSSEVASFRKVAGRTSYEGIESVLRAIETAKTRIKAAVSHDLAMELLLLEIKDNG